MATRPAISSSQLIAPRGDHAADVAGAADAADAAEFRTRSELSDFTDVPSLAALEVAAPAV
jgi:hypothetical protein